MDKIRRASGHIHKAPAGGDGRVGTRRELLEKGARSALESERVGLLFSTRNDAGGKPAERARRRACRVSFSDATGSQVSCSPLDPWFVLADPSALDRGRWRLPSIALFVLDARYLWSAPWVPAESQPAEGTGCGWAFRTPLPLPSRLGRLGDIKSNPVGEKASSPLMPPLPDVWRERAGP